MKEEKFQIKLVAVGLATIVAAALFSTNSFADTKTANTIINGTIGSTISLTSGSTVNIAVTPSGGAKSSSANDTVSVSTNNVTGYALTLQMNGVNNNLVSGGNTIVATSGSQASPAALANNSWGYRVDGIGGFGAGVTTAETDATTSAFTWAGVPLNGSPNTIKTSSTTASAEQTKVWYAIKVDSSKPTGTYTGVVTYTATTN